MFLVYVAVSVTLYVSGDVLGKIWALNNDWRWFWLGLLVYTLGGATAFYSIREASLSLALLVMPPIAIILSLMAGRFLFDERLSFVQYMAGGVILFAVIILLWNSKW